MKKISLNSVEEFQHPFDIPCFRIKKIFREKNKKVFDLFYGNHEFRLKFSKDSNIFTIKFKNNGLFPTSKRGCRGDYNSFSDIFRKAVVLYRERVLYQIISDFRSKMKRIFCRKSVSVEVTEWKTENVKKPAVMGLVTQHLSIPDFKVRTVLGVNFKDEKYLGRVGILSNTYNYDSEFYENTLTELSLCIDKQVHNYL